MDPYSADHKAPTSRSDSFTIREQNQLGMYRSRGLLRFRDTEAYYCTGCRQCYGIYCPNCKVKAPTIHFPDSDPIFTDAGRWDWWDGHNWMEVYCRKCSYLFKVIIR